MEFIVNEGSTKANMLQLLFLAKQVLEHDARIEKLTLDDAELNDSATEDAFEDIRSALVNAMEKVEYYVD